MTIKPVVAIFILAIPIMLAGCLGSDALSEGNPCPYDDAIIVEGAEEQGYCFIVTDAENIVGPNNTDNLVVIEYQGCWGGCDVGDGFNRAFIKDFYINAVNNQQQPSQKCSGDSDALCGFHYEHENEDTALWGIGDKIILSESVSDRDQSQLCAYSPCEIDVAWHGYRHGETTFGVTIILE